MGCGVQVGASAAPTAHTGEAEDVKSHVRDTEARAWKGRLGLTPHLTMCVGCTHALRATAGKDVLTAPGTKSCG